MTETIHFDGTIETLQPYTSTTPGAKVPKGKPSPVTKTYVGGNFVTCINSATIKGGLRRACAVLAHEYEKKVSGEEKPFTLAQHRQNRTGGTKGKGSQTILSFDQLRLIKDTNPLVSLFGAGEPFIKGSISVDLAVSDNDTVIETTGVRSDDFMRTPELIEQLDEAGIEEFASSSAEISAMSKLKKERDQLNREGYLEQDATKKAAIFKKRDAVSKKLEAFDTVSTQMPLSGYEAIPQGTLLKHAMRIQQNTDSTLNLGFLLMALEYFSYQPVMGGKINNGCGEVAMQYDVKTTAYRQEAKHLGSVKVIPYSGLEIEGEDLLTAYEIAKVAFDTGKLSFKIDV